MIPVIGFIGYSGCGKTTLIEKLLPLLKKNFANIAVIKSTHHEVEIDIPGKDSYRYRQNGAASVILAAPNATLSWRRRQHAEDLPSLVAACQPQSVNLILFEGFKSAHYPKIIVYRSIRGQFPSDLLDSSCIAVACDIDSNLNDSLEQTTISRLNIDDPHSIADYINRRIAHAHDTTK